MIRLHARIRRLLPAAVTLIALSQIDALAHAAQRTVYAGTLQGAGDIVMELDSRPTADGMLTGRYFYPKHGVDIPLRGAEKTLYEPRLYQDLAQAKLDPETDTAQATAAASWQGTRDADGYRGQWTDIRTGKTRRFTLRRVADYDPDKLAPGSVQAVTDAISGGMGSAIDSQADINVASAPYETLKLAGYARPVGQDIGTAAVAYRLWVDPRTKFAYPRLSRHPDPQIITRINHLLEQRHWQKSLAALQCMASAYTNGNPAAGTLGSYDDEVIQVDWLSKALMTVTEAGSLYCGGAHPDNHFEPYTFDLLRGEYLDWNRIFPAYVPGQYGFADESPTLIKLMNQARERLPAEVRPARTDDDSLQGCSDFWPDYLALGVAAPGEISLSISGIGHALGVCLGTHATVPFNDLTPYLEPGGAVYLITQ